MNYGVYLTIDGGKEMILVGLYRTRKEAVSALHDLAGNEEKIRMQAKGKNVTCLEVMDRRNFTTPEYIPHIQ